MRGELFRGGEGIPARLNNCPIHGHPGTSLKVRLTKVGHSPRVSTDRFLLVLERMACFAATARSR